MKIVIATGIYPPDIGGPAIYSKTLAYELNKRGFDIGVICYSDNVEADLRADRQRESARGSFRVIRISRKYPKIIRYFLYFWKLARLAKGADVIYAQGPLNSGLPAMLASKLLRKRFALKLVGDYAWEQGMERFGVKDLIGDFQEKKYSWRVELMRKIQKAVSLKADVVITPSNYIKGIVSGRGVNPERIKVVYNAALGIRPRCQSVTKKDKARASLPARRSEVILSIGRLVPWKGFDTLIEIMPDLIKKNSDFRLIIAGDGPEKDNLESKIKELNLEGKVELAGRVSRQKVLDYLRSSGVFVLNTGYEGLSHLLIEAMACGIPIVTTKVCGNPETVRDGHSGLLIKYNNRDQLKDAILKLWGDKKLQEKLIKNGFKALERFRPERMFRETIKILNK